jgi:Tol biopolymer transport system component
MEIFSPDGRRIAYTAWNGTDNLLVINNKEFANRVPSEWDHIEFTSNSRHVNFLRDSDSLDIVSASNDWNLTHIQGTEHMHYFRDLTAISPNKSHMAFIGKHSKGPCVIVDGKRGPVHEAVLRMAPSFSPDSKHIAYAAQDYGVWRLFIDGQAGLTTYDSILLNSRPYFVDSDTVTLAAGRGNEWMTVTTRLS